MDLDRIVDLALNYLYENPGKGGDVVMILEQTEILFNEENSKIICEKLMQFDYYDIQEYASRHGYNLGLMPNVKGYEFYQKYRSHSNYTKIKERQDDIAKKIANKSSMGSYWSGIGAMIAIPLSVISLYFAYSSYRKGDNQDAINAAIGDSLKKIKIEVKSLSKSINKPLLPPAKMGSLVNSKKK